MRFEARLVRVYRLNGQQNSRQLALGSYFEDGAHPENDPMLDK